jgi:hypothetical protein
VETPLLLFLFASRNFVFPFLLLFRDQNFGDGKDSICRRSV